MSKDASIEELTDRLGKTVERIEDLQQKKSLGTRMRQHFSKQGSFVVNAALAGCVFFVAVGRLHQKNEFQNERQEWEEQRRKLQQENFRIEQERQLQEDSIAQLKQTVRSELEKGGWRLAPVAQRLRQVLGLTGVGTEELHSAQAAQHAAEQHSSKRLTMFQPLGDGQHGLRMYKSSSRQQAG